MKQSGMPGFHVQNGRLFPARHLDSPNQNERSSQLPLDMLVIHNISLPPGEFGSGCVEQLFCNCLDTGRHESLRGLDKLRVSSHLLIDRYGIVTQFVDFNRRAWHAGVSAFQGRENCNDFSIGIELEGTDTQDFTDIQYATLAVVVRLLMQEYPLITLDRIVGHSDIAPGRKTDPGPCFDWQRLRQGIDSVINGECAQ